MKQGRTRPKGPGIRDVAKEAGVSVTTVSHVLNEFPGARVAPATVDRVHAAAARLGYVPNRMARSLRMQRSGTLGMISDQIATTPYAGQMLLGAQQAGLAHGYTIVLFNTEDDPEVEERAIASLLQFQVDGAIYATMYHRLVSLPPALGDLPTVVLDSELDAAEPDPTGDPAESGAVDPVVPFVIPDEFNGARTAMRELLGAGHRRIGLLLNSDDVPATRGRLAGYRASLEEAGIGVDPSLIAVDVSEAPGGRRAATTLLGRADRPSALFCYNDRMAFGAYVAATAHGLRVPEDLSIVGFDNQELIAEALDPGLTTIALPHFDMGTWAVDRLVALVTGSPFEGPDRLEMPCPLVRRASVAPPERRS